MYNKDNILIFFIIILRKKKKTKQLLQSTELIYVVNKYKFIWQNVTKF